MKFSKYNKNLASAYTLSELENAYENSEKLLKDAVQSGNQKQLNKAMKIHGDIEYALLYKQNLITLVKLKLIKIVYFFAMVKKHLNY